MSEQQEIVKPLPGEIIQALKEGVEIYTALTEAFIVDFVFYDKTLYQWASDLTIAIPNTRDLDLSTFRQLLVQLGANLQIASSYYSVACSMIDAIQGGNNMKRADVITLLVDNYAARGAKRPAATVIEKMADSYLSNTISAEKAAKIVKTFWKQRVDTLLELRKIFEQIGLSLSVEIKFTST
jgi:hypothetical protein